MDWAKVITELEASGLTQSEIALRCGTSQPYISQLKGGKRKQVGYDTGSAMRALHEERCPAKPKRKLSAHRAAA